MPPIHRPGADRPASSDLTRIHSREHSDYSSWPRPSMASILRRSRREWSGEKISMLILDTLEILGNPGMMATIQVSEEDIATGRFREISSIDDLLGELS